MNLLVDSAAKVSVVLLFALAAAGLLRSRSAAVRHWILAVALVSSAWIPVLGLVAPAWHLPPLGSSGARIQPAQPVTAVSGQDSEVIDRSDASAAIVPTRARAQTSGRRDGVVSVGRVVMVVWLIGAMTSLALLLTATAKLAAIVSRSRRVTDPAWIDLAGRVSRAYELGRPVSILETDHPALLVTWGIWRPKVLIPSAARHWTLDRVRIVLSHELGHIRRGDWIVQVVADLLRAVYWFNPLLWIACRRVRQESERACDDAVLGLGVERAEYASELLEIARTFNADRQTWIARLPAPAIARPSTLERRIAAMLNIRLDRHPLTRSARFIVGICVVGLTVLLAGLGAQTFGTVSGIITDQVGGLLPNATLTLTDEQTRTKHEVRSDQTGRFQFVGLTPTDYSLDVGVPGFAAFHDVVSVPGGRSTQKDVTLHIGSVTETINVVDSDEPRKPAQPPAPVTGPPPNCQATAIGGNIKPPTKIRDVRPVYPENLRASKWNGRVVLDAVIGTDGFVKDARAASAVDPDIERAAIAAVNQWQFTPTLLNCSVVEVKMKVLVSFTPRS